MTKQCVRSDDKWCGEHDKPWPKDKKFCDNFIFVETADNVRRSERRNFAKWLYRTIGWPYDTFFKEAPPIGMSDILSVLAEDMPEEDPGYIESSIEMKLSPEVIQQLRDNDKC